MTTIAAILSATAALAMISAVVAQAHLLAAHRRELATMRRVLTAYDTFYTGARDADGIFIRHYVDGDGSKGRRIRMTGRGVALSMAMPDGSDFDAFVMQLREPPPDLAKQHLA